MEAVADRLSEICKELVEIDGKLGAGKKFVKFEIDADKSGKDQFAAAAIFGNIFTEEIIGGGQSTFPVVIKTEPSDPQTREFFHSSFQFQNEILFYSRLLPFLNSFLVGKFRHSSYPFPKFLKGGTGDPVLRSYLILEDVSDEGFRLSERRQLLDLDHFLLIMNKLGKFHALSYVAKHVDPATFLQLTGQIKETSWTDERVTNGHESDILLSGSLTRSFKKFDNTAANNKSSDSVAKPVKENGTSRNVGGEHESELGKHREQHEPDFGKYREKVEKMKKLLIGKPNRFMRDITTPREPMAVLNHGDFCRNNILFQYAVTGADSLSASKNDCATHATPTNALFFDMATIRYASPVIDLSFCIYLNSNAEMRRLHWDKILGSYYEGLKDTVEEYARENGVQVVEGKHNYTSSDAILLPSLQDVRSEFVLHALYGLVHCSFFLPMMMGLDSNIPAQPQETDEPFDFWGLPTEEKLKVQNLEGGEEGTRALNDIVEHLFEMGFV